MVTTFKAKAGGSCWICAGQSAYQVSAKTNPALVYLMCGAHSVNFMPNPDYLTEPIEAVEDPEADTW